MVQTIKLDTDLLDKIMMENEKDIKHLVKQANGARGFLQRPLMTHAGESAAKWPGYCVRMTSKFGSYPTLTCNAQTVDAPSGP